MGTCSLIGIAGESPDAAGHEYGLRLTQGSLECLCSLRLHPSIHLSAGGVVGES